MCGCDPRLAWRTVARPLVLVPARHSPRADGHRTAVVSGGRLYADALARAGAVPLYLPPTDDPDAVRDAVRACDAVLLLGGGDVAPERYDRERGPFLHGVDEALDAFEVAAITAALDRDVPLLAVCRGAQILNVALGGTLHQHIGDSHRDVLHAVTVEPGTRTAGAVGDGPVRVHCFHHQSVEDVAPDLVVTARHPDGTVEGLEHRSARWVVGTQWHPEDTAGTDSAQQRLFAAFVSAASRA